MAVDHLTPAQLATIKDCLLMRVVTERGGEWTLTFEELEAIGREFDGWAVMLVARKDGMILRVQSPEAVKA